MSRNGSGVYTLPEPPFTPNTPISSAAVNSDLSNIADALTGSVASDGQTSMTGALKMSAAGAVYVVDPDTGIKRTGANAQAIFCGGTDVVELTSSGINVNGTLSQNDTPIPVLPVGLGPLPWCGTAAPSGWLLCFGQAISRTTYAALFTAIGTNYGTGDGTTTFNLPDLRGRVPAGRDNMGGSAASRLTAATITPDGNTLAGAGGEQTHALTLAENGAHTHGYSGTTASGGTAISALSIAASSDDNGDPSGFVVTGLTTYGSAAVAATATGGGPHTHTYTGTTDSSGSGTAHNNVPPTIITNYIIFAGV